MSTSLRNKFLLASLLVGIGIVGVSRSASASPIANITIGFLPSTGTFTAGRLASLDATRDVGLYAVDAVVRRSRPLQETREARKGAPGGAA